MNILIYLIVNVRVDKFCKNLVAFIAKEIATVLRNCRLNFEECMNHPDIDSHYQCQIYHDIDQR